MIADLAEFGHTGVVHRRVADLDVPVEAWRAAMHRAGRRDRTRVRTFLFPPVVTGGDDHQDQLVFAVRIDPHPCFAVQRHRLLRRWRLDEPNMPSARWRTALYRIAHLRRAGGED